MAISIALLAQNVDGSGNNLLYGIGTLTFSGNYVTGGDTMDFTTVAEKLGSTQIIQVFADSQNGNSGYYVPVAGTALNNWKLKAFSGGGTEVTAGAYPASVTTDVVQITVTARKLQQREDSLPSATERLQHLFSEWIVAGQEFAEIGEVLGAGEGAFGDDVGVMLMREE